jgi:hypothetical protein
MMMTRYDDDDDIDYSRYDDIDYSRYDDDDDQLKSICNYIHGCQRGETISAIIHSFDNQEFLLMKLNDCLMN